MKSCMFVVPSLSDGGAERVVSILSSELTKSVENVYVMVYWDTDFNYPVDSKVRVINLSGGDKHTYEQMEKKYRVKKMREIIKRENPDVIIPFLPQVCLQVGIATLGMGCNVIQTIRNDPKSSPSGKVRRLIRDYQVLRSKCTLVQNEEQLDYFPKHWRKKLHILPNPINEAFLEAEYLGSEKFHAVAVGRLIEQKNYPMLIEAFSAFAKNHSDVTLSIYGDGPLTNQLNSQITEYGMSNQIFLKGRSNQLPDILAHASVFIMASNFEGMPNSLMEAMALGVPVISTDCPTGPKDLIGNNEFGYLVETGNSRLLAETIEAVCQNYELAHQKSIKAKKMMASKFGAAIIAQKLEKIFEEVVPE